MAMQLFRNFSVKPNVQSIVLFTPRIGPIICPLWPRALPPRVLMGRTLFMAREQETWDLARATGTAHTDL